MSFTTIAITTRSQIICTETMSLATSATGVMSPNPTVDKTVIVRHSAADLSSGSENVLGSLTDIAT
jgi:hypothetical protein